MVVLEDFDSHDVQFLASKPPPPSSSSGSSSGISRSDNSVDRKWRNNADKPAHLQSVVDDIKGVAAAATAAVEWRRDDGSSSIVRRVQWECPQCTFINETVTTDIYADGYNGYGGSGSDARSKECAVCQFTC